MSDPTSRMLRLLTLLQTHRFWPGGELSDRLGVSPRTLRRDIDRLRELGYPVDATRGVAGGYRLQAGTTLPPLLLDDDEAVAIAVGLRTAATGSVDGIEETSVRALAKLEQVLPQRLRRRVHALSAFTVPFAYPRRFVLDPEALTLIAQACRDNERLQFEYQRRDGESATRSVEPHRLVSIGQRWYLVAFDTHRDAWRSFRIDRMSDPRVSGARFHPRELPAEDAATFVQDGIGAMSAQLHAVMTVHAPAAHVEERARWFGGKVEPLGDDRCRLTMTAESMAWLGATVALLEAAVEVHEPAELHDYLAALRERLGRMPEAPRNAHR